MPHYHELLILFLLAGIAGGYAVAKIIDGIWAYKQRRKP